MKVISREDDPEIFAYFDKVEECEKRGHSKWITHRNGYIECHECGDTLGSFHRDKNMPYVDGDCAEDADDALF